jgi:cytochrome c oxidase cbb3-type subunit 3
MSSRFRNSAAALALVALLRLRPRGAQSRGKPLAETIPDGRRAPTRSFRAMRRQLPPLDPRAAAYEGNAPRSPRASSCSLDELRGCHSHGGGGMGPALMDGKWRYGGRIDQIAASIAEGRPNGMPAWRGKLTEQQMWQLAAYVRPCPGRSPQGRGQRPRRRR